MAGRTRDHPHRCLLSAMIERHKHGSLRRRDDDRERLPLICGHAFDREFGDDKKNPPDEEDQYIILVS